MKNSVMLAATKCEVKCGFVCEWCDRNVMFVAATALYIFLPPAPLAPPPTIAALCQNTYSHTPPLTRAAAAGVELGAMGTDIKHKRKSK